VSQREESREVGKKYRAKLEKGGQPGKRDFIEETKQNTGPKGKTEKGI